MRPKHRKRPQTRSGKAEDGSRLSPHPARVRESLDLEASLSRERPWTMMIRKSFGRRICNSRLQVDMSSIYRNVVSGIFIRGKTQTLSTIYHERERRSLWICQDDL
jgi:hypothetical protein